MGTHRDMRGRRRRSLTKGEWHTPTVKRALKAMRKGTGIGGFKTKGVRRQMTTEIEVFTGLSEGTVLFGRRRPVIPRTRCLLFTLMAKLLHKLTYSTNRASIGTRFWGGWECGAREATRKSVNSSFHYRANHVGRTCGMITF